jgi:hypothetical protein
LEQSKRFLLELAARAALISDGMLGRTSTVALADMALRKEKNSEARDGGNDAAKMLDATGKVMR